MKCANGKAGIAKTCEKKYPAVIYKGMLLLVPGFRIPSPENLADRSYLITQIANGNIFPIQNLVSVTSEDTEGNVEDTNTQVKIHNFDGLRGAMYEALLPLESHKIARTYNDINWEVIYIDLNGTYIFSMDENDEIKGFDTNLFHVWPLPTPSETSTKTRIQIQESDIDELDKNGWFMNPTYSAKKLYGPLDILISSTVVAANAWTATLTYQNNGKFNGDGTTIDDTEYVEGLTAADFEVWDQNGDLLTPVTDYTVTETSPGVYAFDATSAGMTSGEMRVKTLVEPLVRSLVLELAA